MKKFNSVLVANRGEIACRIIKTLKKLGIFSISIYSRADSDALHVDLADDAIYIGPEAASESYLSTENILNAALKTGAEAIHPGYGFLSENFSFAEAVIDSGLTFIGPPVEAIKLMGNKAEAKKLMNSIGVPCVPGYQEVNKKDEILINQAIKIGFPIMIKSAMGGGGRGLRVVSDKEMMRKELSIARSESLNSFGSDSVFLEKHIQNTKHIEFQVFADHHGNFIHLGERDCSVQRRHQKIIEESPSPALNKNLRKKMGQSAIEAAKAVKYEGAGTVEFLLDRNDAFYFLEMNTRIQVEHPVTEMITGLDIVEMQINVALGRNLNEMGKEFKSNGHAIEARLCAEDARNDFLPSQGVIRHWKPCKEHNLRIDFGIKKGQKITSFYDSLMAKIIAWGKTRELARKKLINAIENTEILGLPNNLEYLKEILEHKVFANGKATTSLIDGEFIDRKKNLRPSFLDASIASALAFWNDRENALAKSINVDRKLLCWTNASSLSSKYYFECDNIKFNLIIYSHDSGIRVEEKGGESILIEYEKLDVNSAKLKLDGKIMNFVYEAFPGKDVIFSHKARQLCFKRVFLGYSVKEQISSGCITAPMHGKVINMFVAEGDIVSRGDTLAVLEAMKMQHQINSDLDGKVKRVFVKPGDQLEAENLIVELEEKIKKQKKTGSNAKAKDPV